MKEFGLGFAIALSVAALGVGLTSLVQTKQPQKIDLNIDAFGRKIGPISSNDQPVTMAGGSLKLHWGTSTLNSLADWTPDSANAPKYYTYQSTLPADRVEWACTYDSPMTTSIRLDKNPLKVDVTYSHPGGNERHKLHFETKSDGTALTLRVLKDDGTSVALGLYRALFEFGEHPRRKWNVTSATSQNLKNSAGGDANINCGSNDGELLIIIHPCGNQACPAAN